MLIYPDAAEPVKFGMRVRWWILWRKAIPQNTFTPLSFRSNHI